MQLGGAQAVERPDDGDPEVAPEAAAFGLEAGAIHHDAAGVIHPLRISDATDWITVTAHHRGGRRCRAVLPISVQDEDADLMAREVHGRVLAWRGSDDRGWANRVGAGGRRVRGRVSREEGSSDDDEQHEFDCGDTYSNESGGAPGPYGVERCERMIHGVT